MARVKISELTAKKLLHTFLELPYTGVNSFDVLDENKSYVVKVDEGIKKRMTRGLVGLNKSKDEARDFITELNEKGFRNVIIEEMVSYSPEQEMYLSLERIREGFRVLYSKTGGINIEESGSVQESTIYAESETDDASRIEKNLGVPQLFISQIIGVMNKYHFSFLEINPLVVMENGKSQMANGKSSYYY